VPGFTARLIKAFARRTIKRNGLSNEQLVRHLRRHFNHTPVVPLLPKGVRLRRVHTRSFDGDLVRTVKPGMAVLYIHGGAYIAGVTRTYHNLAGRLSAELNAAVYLPIYPFAPENPFPHAVNRVIEAYEFLLAEGYAGKDIVIAGDSAGGGLSLALLLAIRDQNLPTPRCALLFSPGTDARTLGQSVTDNDDADCMLSADMVRKVARIYVPNEADRIHPYASPCLADYRGLPPLFITVAKDEVLYSDAVAAREQARKADVPVEWIERDGLFHVWPIMVPFLKEAREDLARAIAFVRDRG
jgi:epsilon-lactone hydrolase